ncbi:hypothetical protein C8R44DRAFT_831192 [Mycena epipterygia]|nr:hypothetical protein C8R44DRAFT_831192 [Mycena epipterygia]
MVSGACQRATFGRNGDDILDETYRKAEILDVAHSQLLEGFSDANKHINAEFYKFNICGFVFQGAQGHPRAGNMFRSLVVVFPTFHVGGALLLRHDNKEQVFDSSRLLSPFNTSKVAYAAFYGDVEYEVTVVDSGHRVTLTYNLYFAEGSPHP